MRFPAPSDHNGPHGDVRGCIDLHMHSTCSDGEQEPEYLVEWAAKLGLQAMALTDHDTCKGVARAVEAGKRLGVEIIPGIEISVSFSGGTFHLLGYFVDYQNQAFTQKLEALVQSRYDRNRKIVAALAEHGMPVSEAELQEEAGEAVIGRPHIARVLIKKGFVGEFREAFDRWIGEGKPCYFEKEKFGPRDAIALVRSAGGVPVVAHPLWLGLPSIEALDETMGELKSQGLMGMECVYSDHDQEYTRACREIATKHGLIVTGGSDYHGGNTKPEVTLGHGPGGGFRIPPELLEGLRWARDQVRAEG